MPLNLPSHAHGEGYSDMNIVIPEFVKRVNFEKGPYYANIGNYGSAGAAHVESFKTLPQNFVKIEGGTYGYGRAVFGASRQLGTGNLLYGGEAYYDNGPWVHPDAYAKFNGLLTYSKGSDVEGVASRPAPITVNGIRAIRSRSALCLWSVYTAHSTRPTAATASATACRRRAIAKALTPSQN